MTIVGVHLTKITAARNVKSAAQKVGINNNISIKNVEPHDFALGKATQQGLKFSFVFNCIYTPDLGTIDFEGDVLFLGEEEETEKVKKEWEANKKLPADFAEPILNAALMRSNIQAIKLSTDMGLPSPVPLPRIEKKEVKTEQPKAKAK
ncbi:MAG TPA: hypothetical protein VJH88_05615 [Candidatus Nanoarchaeia archaeon]|nr:hypothetical protein [Candidatus Nanoarchaeia archaeon]